MNINFKEKCINMSTKINFNNLHKLNNMRKKNVRF